MNLHQAWREHLRICLLRVLAEAPAYSANESLLTDVVGRLGILASRDQVKTELSWLAEQGLVSLEHLEPVLVATLTDRGLDVAQGRASQPGVKRPSPKG